MVVCGLDCGLWWDELVVGKWFDNDCSMIETFVLMALLCSFGGWTFIQLRYYRSHPSSARHPLNAGYPDLHSRLVTERCLPVE